MAESKQDMYGINTWRSEDIPKLHKVIVSTSS